VPVFKIQPQPDYEGEVNADYDIIN